MKTATSGRHASTATSVSGSSTETSAACAVPPGRHGAEIYACSITGSTASRRSTWYSRAFTARNRAERRNWLLPGCLTPTCHPPRHLAAPLLPPTVASDRAHLAYRRQYRQRYELAVRASERNSAEYVVAAIWRSRTASVRQRAATSPGRCHRPCRQRRNAARGRQFPPTANLGTSQRGSIAAVRDAWL